MNTIYDLIANIAKIGESEGFKKLLENPLTKRGQERYERRLRGLCNTYSCSNLRMQGSNYCAPCYQSIMRERFSR